MQHRIISSARRVYVARVVILTLALLLGVAFSLGVTAFAHAGWGDWFSPTDPQPAQKPRTVKKAGLKPQTAKKKSATTKMMSNLTSNLAGTKSLFSPKPPVSHSNSRSVPRKMVADKPAKPSMLKRLFTPEPPQQPRTVSEFIQQKRPS
jgi:hypothetical protein